MNTDIHEDYKHPRLRYDSGKDMELDIFIPDLNLAFEYQGEQHYYNRTFFVDLQTRAQRDQEKKSVLKKLGITLIEVPYNWSKNMTLYEIRKEILLEKKSSAKTSPVYRSTTAPCPQRATQS